MKFRWFWCLVFIAALAGCSSFKSSRAKDYVAQAKVEFNKGEFQESLRYLHLVEKNTPLSEEMHLLKMSNFIGLGKLSEAHGAIHSGLEQRPHSSKLLLALARWHVDYGILSEAKIRLARVIERDPQNTEARKLLGRVFMMDKEWMAAEIQFEKALYKDKQDLEAAFYLGQNQYKQSKHKEAIASFKQSFRSPEYQDQSARYLAWLHTEDRNVREANHYIRHLVMKDSEASFTQKMYMRNLLNIPEVDKVAALKNYNEKNDNDWGKQQYWLALQEADMNSQATDYLADLWNHNPGTVWVAANYARELHQLGDVQVANTVLQKSMKHMKGGDAELLKTQANLLVVEASAPKPAERSLAQSEPRYKVQVGDTLQGISHKLFKTTLRWKEIQKLNEKNLSSTNILPVGLDLVIPEDI